MRVIGGEFRSRRLVFPKTKQTRPMTDRAKETIFNILGETVSGSRVLDLFAGSGSMGIEALSRGAVEAVFVEKNPWGHRSIRENLKSLGLEGRSRLIALDATQAIRRLEREGENFQLIFLDPPYYQGFTKKILNQLDQSDILTPLTRLVVHYSRQEKLPEGLERLEVLREKRIGQACLTFLSGKRS